MEALEAKEYIKRKRSDRRYKRLTKTLSVCLIISIFNLFLLINGINVISAVKSIGESYFSSENGEKLILSFKGFSEKIAETFWGLFSKSESSTAQIVPSLSFSVSKNNGLYADMQKLPEEDFIFYDITPPTPEGYSLEPVFISRKLFSPLDSLRVTSPFSWRIHPFAKKILFHTGTDYAAAVGDNVYSVLPGTIEETGFDSSFGNFIVVSHPGNIKTKYAHLDEIIAIKGTNIKAGDIIGKAGETGGATGPHLHFEISLNGITYNPEYLLESEYGV